MGKITEMAEHLEIAKGGKMEKYGLLLRQIQALVEMEKDLTAVLANTAAMIHFTFGFLWTGFYIVKGDCLVVGPFQGPLACNRIRYGKGVCGTSWKEGRTITVEDVDKFPGHIACSSESKSEIVVPVMAGNEVKAVIDIDSDELSRFDEADALWLERISAILAPLFEKP